MNPYTEISAHIARSAQLAMLLEVSASPKPGNVDREHDFPDTSYEHFLASSVGVYPVLEEAAGGRKGIGTLLVHAVSESVAWQKGGNTHFGAFLLLIPLAMAAGEILSEKREDRCTDGSGPGISGPEKLEGGDLEALVSRAHALVRATDSGDAVEFYRAFAAGGVRVNSVEEFDLEASSSTAELREQNVSLYDLMEISKGYDLIANEWTTGFRRCLEGAETVLAFMQARNGESASEENSGKNSEINSEKNSGKNSEINSEKNFGINHSGTGINEAVVYTFLKLLSRHRDTFIQTKFDAETADRASSRARSILSTWENQDQNSVSGQDSGSDTGLNAGLIAGKRDFRALLPALREFDSELLEQRINPGSTADVIIAGLFIALLGGLRF
ncbi:MAG: triphosphoribosyl-dephospho-CoA synthase [Methanosarcinaceae archaeon]|nr:triphosphoribosyl-dephospho-CoA synthase [Methanosarcinaceae archaeon]